MENDYQIGNVNTLGVHSRVLSWCLKELENADVDIENLSIYQHPDNPDMFIATFTQNYESDNYSSRSVKRQYWINEAGRWHIAYEGEPQKGKP